MPLKTFIGTNLTVLLRQAQHTVGTDAVILHVRRIRTGQGRAFEVAAADPGTAARRAARGPATPGERLETMVPEPPPRGPLVLAVVGRTGVGKTTLIAKLATHPRLFPGRRVGIVSLDSFRVGAAEQLGTYAAIGRHPFETVYRAGDLPAARSRLADRDVLLVDTPGRSPRNRRDLEVADELLRALAPAEVHLAVPAGTPAHLTPVMLREAQRFGVTHLAATKLDEAPDDTTVFDLALGAGLPMRWVTAGQDVPFDLGTAADALAAARLSRTTPLEPVA